MSNNKLNIEKIFKDAFDNYEVDPGSNAWESIQSKMGAKAAASASGSAAVSTATSSWLTTTLIVVAIATAGIGTYFLLNDANDSHTVEQQTTTHEIESPENHVSEEAIPLNDISKEKEIVEADSDNISITSIKEKPNNNKPTKSSTKDKSDYSTVNKNKKVDSNEQQEEEIIIITDETSDSEIEDANQQNINSNQHTTDNQREADSKGVNEGDQTIEPTTPKIISEPNSYIPNIFSPNGDGTNDIWEITIEEYDAVDIVVFDVNNNIVYRAKDLNHPWDGKLMDGRNAAEGVYFYKIIIELQEEVFRKAGSVSLKR